VSDDGNVLLRFLWRFFWRLFRRCCRCRDLRFGPVVQVVRDLVAFAALREFRHNTGGMRRAVAILTERNHLVLFLVAECAREGAVLDLARCECLQNGAMTCGAIF